ELGIACGVVVEYHEALHADASLQHGGEQGGAVVGAGGRRVVVVMGDHAAHRHAGVVVEQGQHGVEHLATHAFEIHVDAARAGGGEAFGQLWRVTVEAGVV